MDQHIRGRGKDLPRRRLQSDLFWVSYQAEWGGGLYYGRLVDGAKPYSHYLTNHALDRPRIWLWRGVNEPLHAINLEELSLAQTLENRLFTGLSTGSPLLRYSRRFSTIGARTLNSVLEALWRRVAKLATYLRWSEILYFRQAWLTYGAKNPGTIRTSSAAMITSNGNWSAASTNSWFCTSKIQRHPPWKICTTYVAVR